MAGWRSNQPKSVNDGGSRKARRSAPGRSGVDAGFPIEVESDYLPSELLNRAWLGEFHHLTSRSAEMSPT
ncbi:hypothetical protein GCM10010393_19380 [Streptomyces gobitricini]|uniref:Transposase n=1 Tax=Streptomyces gobitricini TaxID=68211 RepID=A0ABP5YZ43_9ACTN